MVLLAPFINLPRDSGFTILDYQISLTILDYQISLTSVLQQSLDASLLH